MVEEALEGWLSRNGYRCFYNIPVGGKIPDLVALKNGKILSIEVKKHAIELATAIGQCLLYQTEANKVFIALPTGETNLIADATLQLLKKHGIGLLEISKNVRIIIEAKYTHVKNNNLIEKILERTRPKIKGKEGRDLKRDILSVLEEHKEGITIGEMAKYLGVTRTTAAKYLYGLVSEGKVKERNLVKMKLHYLPKYYDETKKIVAVAIGFILFFNLIPNGISVYSIQAVLETIFLESIGTLTMITFATFGILCIIVKMNENKLIKLISTIGRFFVTMRGY